MQRRDSEELPEIKDYSNASPWEDFTAAIQEVVRGWLVDAAGDRGGRLGEQAKT